MGRRRWAMVLWLGCACLAIAHRAAADTTAAERAYQRGDFAAAAAELLPLAHDGDPKAQFLVGRMAFYGQVLSQDAGLAAGWFRRAAEQGFAPAQLAYANALDNGWGVQGDPAQAVPWYLLAAFQGERAAMWHLAYDYRRGRGVVRDLVEAWAWFDQLAALGDADASRERDWIGLVALDEAAQARQRSRALARALDLP